MHYLILGLGKTGYSCVVYLRSIGCTVTVFDDAISEPHDLLINQYPEVAVFNEYFDYKMLHLIDFVVVSPGVMPGHEVLNQAKKHNVKITTDLDLFAENTTAKYILVTGTNGKSTVVTLVADILCASGLKAVAAGNIGLPVLNCLVDDIDWVVIEASSFSLHYSNNLLAEAGVVLNIGHDHLDWHGSMENYLQAKLKTYDYSKIAVCNFEQKQLNKQISNKKIVSFASKKEADWQVTANGDICYFNEVVVEQQDYSNMIAGLAINIAASCALSKVAGVNNDVMKAAVKEFSGLKHRCQVIGKYNGVLWVNDSKATNLHAVFSAVDVMYNKRNKSIILFLSGNLKAENWQQGLEWLAVRCRQIVLVGKAVQQLVSLCDKLAVNYIATATLQQAIFEVKNIVLSEEVVLFSPGGASFDMFNNFEHRGEVFSSLVKAEVGYEK